MTAQQLKNSILQMAVQGKLVPQDPSDEPASVLIERIREEKAQLIKEGKIKKEKNPSRIFRGADNLPYEQIGKKEPVCIADEVPFDIPDSWEWVRLKCIAIINPRNDLTDNIDVAFIPMPLLMDGYRNEHSFVTKKWKEIKSGFTHFAENDIIVAKITPCFQNRKSAILHNLPNGYGAGTTELHVVRRVSNSVNNEYLLWIFKSAYFIDNGVKAFSGTAGQQRVGKPYMDSLLIPLPPLEEQNRIVKKIQEVMPFCSNYEKAHETIEQLNASFPDQLKKSILQWAVQGKLVPQDPNDEPATLLLERIRAEKEQLIKAGKIKRDKHESVIFRRDNSHYEKRGSEEVCIDNEIPFEIPDSWCWSRLSSLCYKVTDGSHNPPPKRTSGYRVISAKNIKNGEIVFEENDRYADQAGFNKENPRTDIQKDDIILGIIGGSIGNTAIYNHNDQVIAQRSIAIIGTLIPTRYMKTILDSPLCQSEFSKRSNGTAQGGIYLGELSNLLVPVPPINEISRILITLEVCFSAQSAL